MVKVSESDEFISFQNYQKSYCRLDLIFLFIAVVTIVFVFILPYQSICETERKALAGDPASERLLAYNYQFAARSPECSWGRFAPNERKAMQWLQAAAKQGDSDAVYMLPQLYEHDFPGERSGDVVKWYLQAARQGDADGDGSSVKRLIDIYRYGQLGQARDPMTVAYWEAVRR